MSYSNEAGTRAYEVYAPPSRNAAPRPLLVMLHGCAQDPADFAAGTGMNRLAERHDFVVLYPAQAPTANAMRCWNWFNPADQLRDQGEPALLAGMARHVAAAYSVDKRRIFLAGLSAGAAMALILSDTYDDVFAALGVHSGFLYGGVRTGVTRSMPTIVFHGDADIAVNVSQGAEIARRCVARESALCGSLRGAVENRESGGRDVTVTRYRNEAARELVEYWVVHGAGHTWSGGSAKGSFTDVGGPNASAEMVRFFLRV
jgi:poly(hydroxyalkanoate) depolymerase family esterase